MPDVGIQTAAVQFVGSAALICKNKAVARFADAAANGCLIGLCECHACCD
jgi:hypothetical protein